MVQPDRPHIIIFTSRALYVVDNYVYRNTLSIRNAYCFSTAAVVTRTLATMLRYRQTSCLFFQHDFENVFSFVDIMYYVPSKPRLL
jgi:hypothetical protein